ncbi:hypothetical protein ACFQUU_08790 [Herbaspirillum sp. GCM10030257]|uniref:hypothetical protein n=1 Tax=Herbaspirillum sp. GCM10030257 TaxID=3273393 RepID=UPI003608E62C
MRQLGAPEEVIQAAEKNADKPAEDEDFGVFEENWRTFLFFRDLRTKWDLVVLPSGRVKRVGLQWSEAERLMKIRHLPRKDRTALWDDLLMMELEALDVFSQAR